MFIKSVVHLLNEQNKSVWLKSSFCSIMAKPGSRVLVQDKEMKEIAAEIHLGLYTLTKIYKTTQDFEKCFQQVREKICITVIILFCPSVLNIRLIGI